ncbi:MAG TPA: two-component regulator propeller domain-containing protein, partial [Bacteroidia bacterium]
MVKVPNLKLKLLVLQVLLFLWKFDAKAQYLQSFNYNINDGLISNKVYNIMEDRNGFIWICTDQGVSRFDGINFQNFTTKEGLPNNEILNVFEDSKGRIWFNSFGTEPCYYENSKIYNSDNDSLLRRIKYNKPQGLCLTSIVQWNNSLAFLIKQGEHKCFVGKDIQDIRIIDSNLIRSYQFQNILIQTGNTYHLVSPIDVFSWENGKTLRKTNIEHWGNSFFYYSVSPFSIIEGVRNLNNRIELYSLDL